MLQSTLAPKRLMVELCLASKSPLPPPFYQSVRSNHHKNHAKLTYSKIGTSIPRLAIVDPKLLKVGEPVSSTLMLGDMVKAREFKFDLDSLNARGFLRFQKPYTPPPDATEKVIAICRSCLGISGDEQAVLAASLEDPQIKYQVLTKTHEQFQHAVPNSMLHMMGKVGDLVQFYCTRVNTQTPFEELVRSRDLPPNVYIQKDPIRFHPETDTMFGGESAFPKSSTIVTGLRTKKKYPGHQAKMTWP